MSEISAKLKIKPEQSILIVNSHQGFIKKLALHANNKVETDENREAVYDFIMLFASNQSELKDFFPKIIRRLGLGSFCWICYPKKSSGIKTDLTRDEGWSVVIENKYTLVSLVSIDDTWTAARMKHSDKIMLREKPDYPEIDYKNRIVTVPPDFAASLYKANLFAVFSNMSFSHKRETVEAILDAKKSETRVSRIEKAIEQLKKTNK
jgi:hypothetical protein